MNYSNDDFLSENNIIDSEGVHEIANTTISERKADIIFIHGLGGSSHSTWRFSSPRKKDHFFWPVELGLDLPNCGIWCIGYPAGFSAMGPIGMAIEKRAGNIAQKMANSGLGQRPIFFISHSMGGLIIKSLLVGSQVNADKDRKRIARQTCGIVFCATPHRGSDFATSATRFGAILGGAQNHLQEMIRGQETLDFLHDQFIEWQRIWQVSICSYAENLGLFKKTLFFKIIPFRMRLVVTRDSANPNIANHTVRDVDEDHLSIVKPRYRNSDVYAGTLRFLKECISALPAHSNRHEVVYPPISEEGDLLSTLASLSPKQKEIFQVIASYGNGLQVTVLAEKVGLNRSEVVYRVRELTAQGLLSSEVSEFLTDHQVRISERIIFLREDYRVEYKNALKKH